jgi:Na+/H+ antiporter NhaC
VSDDKKPPVRVKVYGLVSLTRRAYLRFQAVGLTLGLILLIVGISYSHPALPEGHKSPPAALFFARFLEVLPWLCVGILAAMGVETFVVLKRFKEKEKANGGR